MNEYLVIRVPKGIASQEFRDYPSRSHGDVRELTLPWDGEAVERLRVLRQRLGATDIQLAYYSWSRKVEFAAGDLDVHRFFLWRPRACIEPPGHTCGTTFDDSNACARCGSGRARVGPLILKSAPKRSQMAKTLVYDELIVSEQFALRLSSLGLKGFSLSEVVFRSRSSRISTWYSLDVETEPLRIGVGTEFGDDPIRRRLGFGACRECRRLRGLNLISSVRVAPPAALLGDVWLSDAYEGLREGELYPSRLICVSRHFVDAAVKEGEPLASFEPVHIAEGNRTNA